MGELSTRLMTLGEELARVFRSLPGNEWAGDGQWAIWALGGLLLLIVARMAGWFRRRVLAQDVLQMVRDTNLHPVRVHIGPDASGFVAESDPAPEPFEQLMILYTPSSRLDPVGFLRWLLRRQAQTLHIRGMVRQAPSSELIWVRHGRPVGALHQRPSSHTWQQRRLDFADVQYSTRGIDPAPLQHVFAEFQTRFSPYLHAFVVRNESQPHVELVLAAPRLDPLLVAGLLISLRSVGRAAGR